MVDVLIKLGITAAIFGAIFCALGVLITFIPDSPPKPPKGDQ